MSETTDGKFIAAREILAETLGCPSADIAMEDSFETLELWDSLAHMRLIARLEEELGHEFDADEIFDLVSVESIVALLSSQ